MNTRKYIIVMAMMLAFFSTGVQAQKTQDPLLTACEQVADKAKRLELENEQLKIRIETELERNQINRERIQNLQEQVSLLEKSLASAKELDRTSSLIIGNLREQVSDDRLRIKDLEQENKSLRWSRTFRSIVTFGAGVGTGYLLNR